jgi:hypothetical protein
VPSSPGTSRLSSPNRLTLPPSRSRAMTGMVDRARPPSGHVRWAKGRARSSACDDVVAPVVDHRSLARLDRTFSATAATRGSHTTEHECLGPRPGLVSPLAGLGVTPAVSTPGGCDGTARWARPSRSSALPTPAAEAAASAGRRARSPQAAQWRHGRSRTTGWLISPQSPRCPMSCRVRPPLDITRLPPPSRHQPRLTGTDT